MEPGALTILARAAAPVGSRIATSWILSRLVAARVTWQAAGEARTQGIKITKRSLRRWLLQSDTTSQLRQHTPDSMEAAAEGLSNIIAGVDEGDKKEKSLQLLYTVIRCYLAVLKPSEAIALASEWNLREVARESAVTRAELSVVSRDMAENFENRTLFEDRLASLPPLLAGQAFELRDTWPTLETIVSDLTSTGERGRVLEEWARNKPVWLLEASSNAKCWLGEIAASYEVPEAAIEYFLLGLDWGAYPRAYWIARLAHQQARYDLPGALRRLEPEVQNHNLAAALHAGLNEEWEKAEYYLNSWTADSKGDQNLRRVLLASVRSRNEISYLFDAGLMV